MHPMILLQQAELWELLAGLRVNRLWRVWRFRHRQVHWCVEWHAKTPNYDSLDTGRGETRGHAVSHAEGDLKDKEAVACEHRRGMFEVAPGSPARTTTSSRPILTSLTSSLPPSIPYGWVHHTLLARGLWRVQ